VIEQYPQTVSDCSRNISKVFAVLGKISNNPKLLRILNEQTIELILKGDRKVMNQLLV
jgi:hypothetical protein